MKGLLGLCFVLSACTTDDMPPSPSSDVACTVMSVDRLALSDTTCQITVNIDVQCAVESAAYSELLVGWTVWAPLYAGGTVEAPYRCGHTASATFVGSSCKGFDSGFAVFHDPTTDTYAAPCEQQP